MNKWLVLLQNEKAESCLRHFQLVVDRFHQTVVRQDGAGLFCNQTVSHCCKSQTGQYLDAWFCFYPNPELFYSHCSRSWKSIGSSSVFRLNETSHSSLVEQPHKVLYSQLPISTVPPGHQSGPDCPLSLGPHERVDVHFSLHKINNARVGRSSSSYL